MNNYSAYEAGRQERKENPAEREEEMNRQELAKILENHQHWLNEDCEGWEGMKADLSGANLYCATLDGANLYCAKLEGAKNVPFIPYACPDTGSFIGYKKARGVIVELEILADAQRCSATGRKCRCNKAKVLSIQNLDGSKTPLREIPSDHDKTFIYRIGEIVSVDNFEPDRWKECAPGIHFFINRKEAVNYPN